MQQVLAGESLLPQASDVAAAEQPAAEQPAPVERPAAELAAEAEYEADALAKRNYPWAQQFVTAEGQLKVMYNVKRGTVLQPLPQVQPSLAASRRKEAFANPRNLTNPGTNYLRVG